MDSARITQNSALLEKFQTFLGNQGLNHVSVKNYLSDTRKFLLFANPTCPEEITPDTILHYLNHNADIPAGTLNRYQASLRKFSQFLQAEFGLAAKTLPNPAHGSIDILTTQFRQSLVREKLSDSTVKNYLSDINHFTTWFAKNPQFSFQKYPNLTTLLSKNTLNLYQNYLTLSHTTSTVINRRSSAIRKLAFFAFKSQLIPVNPFAHQIHLPKLAPLAWFTRHTNVSQTPQLKIENLKLKIIGKAYEKYTALPFTPYLHLALLVLAVTAMSLFAYDQFKTNTKDISAYPTTLTPPTRQLSFQGRLTDSSDTPITTATNVVFKLFNTGVGGTQLYTTGTCSVSPDSNGIFNSLLGNGTCGSEIPASVFTENQGVWLEIGVGAETLTPRQQIATVAYAINSDTVQGYPAANPATKNTIPVIDNSGNLNIGATSPSIISTSGTFGIEGQALSLITSTASNGNINIAPDGTGSINAIGGVTTGNFLRITDANLTSGNLISGYVGNNSATGNLLSLSSGTTETTQFVVKSNGNVGIGTSSPSVSSLLDLTSTTKGFLAPRMTAAQRDAISTPATGLMIYNTTANQYNVYNGSTWTSVGGSSSWSGITDPSTDLTLNMASYRTSFAWTSGGRFGFDTNGNVGIGNTTPSYPLHVTGDINFTGALRSNGSAGSSGNFLMSTGTGATWTSAVTATSMPWSGLTSPTTNLSLGMTNYITTFNWNSGTGTNNLFSLTSDASANGTGSLLNVQTGAGASLSPVRVRVGSTEAFFVTSTGNVGVGLTNPNNKLDVSGSWPSTYGQVNIQNPSTGFSGISLYSNSTYGGWMYWDSATSAMRIQNYNGGSYGNLTLNGSGGNVGIGTTNPNEVFEINHTTRSLLRISRAGTAIGWVGESDNLFTSMPSSDLGILSNGTKFYLGTTSTPTLTMTSGNVGIGTTNPSQKLDVVGNIQLSGAFMPNGNAGTSGQFLISTGVGTTPTWTSTVPATSVRWDQITNPTTNLSLGMTNYTTTFNWNSGTGTNNLFSLTSDASANGTGSLLNVQTGAGASLSPVRIRTGSTEAFFVTSTGNVGVGLTNPAYKLDISVADQGGVRIQSAGTANFIGTPAGGGGFVINNSSSTGTFMQSGGVSRLVIAEGLRIGSTYATVAAPTNGMIVEGNVGIGTTNPGAKLVIGQNRGNDFLQFYDSTVGTSGTWMKFGIDSGYVNYWKATGADITLDAGDTANESHFIAFKTSKTGLGGISQERVRITTDGNVGIGTTNPSQKLDVVGNVQLSGAFMPNGNAGTSGQFLISTGVGTTPTWTSTVPATSVRWDQITNPLANLSLGMSNFTTTFNWNTGTGTSNAFSLTTDASANGTGSLLNIQTGAGATLSPVRIRTGSTEAFFVTSTGNVGVGTTNPIALLSINGTGYAYTGFRSGNIETGYYASRGTSNSIGVYSGNLYLQDGSTGFTGNVGVGTTNPTQKLQVEGNIKLHSSAPTIYSTMTTISSQPVWVIGDDSNGNLIDFQYTNTADLNIRGATNPATAQMRNFVTFSRNSTSKRTITFNDTALFIDDPLVANGNVGIATTNPGYKLEVNGSLGVGGTATFNNKVKIADGTQGSGYFLNSDTNGVASWTATIPATSVAWSGLTSPTTNLSLGMTNYTTTFNWNSGTGTNNLFSLTSDASANGTGSLLNVQTGAGASLSPVRIRTGSTEAFFVTSTGNVGVGLTNPSVKFDVTGAGYFSAGSGFGINSVSGQNRVQTYGSGTSIRFLDSGNSYADVGVESLSVGNAFAPTLAQANGLIVEGNVGIGISSPSAKLNVFGSGDTRILVNGTPTSVGVDLYLNGGASGYTQLVQGGGVAQLNTNSALGISFSNTGEALRVRGNSVGIGNTNPAYKLDVTGDINFTAALRINASAGSNGQVLTSTGTGATWTSVSALSVGNADTVDNYHVSGTAYYIPRFNSSNNTIENSSTIYNDASGNVGIGTTTLATGTKLDIWGTTRIADTTNAYSGTIYSSYVYTNPELFIKAGSGNAVAFSSNGGVAIGGYTAAPPTNGLYVIGNVGIGYTTLGTATFAVNGNIGIGTTNSSTFLQIGATTTGSSLTRLYSPLNNNSTTSQIINGQFYTTITADRSALYSDEGINNQLRIAYSGGKSGASKAISNSVWAYGSAVATYMTGSYNSVSVSDGGTGSGGSSFEAVGSDNQLGFGAVGVGGTMTTGIGIRSGITTAGSGALGTYYGLQVSNIPAGMTTTTSYGSYIGDMSSATNSYGLYLANQATAGSTHFSLYSNGGTNYFAGNVGIGRSDPNYQLAMTGTLAVGGSSYLMGRVGVGTSTPAYNLDINGTTMHQNATYFANGTTYYVDSSGNAKFLDIIAADTADPGLTVGNGTSGYAKIGNSTIFDGGGTQLNFTAGGTSSVQPHLSIVDTSGNVGLGLSNPSAKLHTIGGDVSTGYTAATIALGYSTTGQYPNFVHTRHNAATSTNNTIELWTSDGTAAGVFPTNAVLGLSVNGGKVGVGVGSSNPEATLDVRGSAWLRGTGTSGLFVDTNGNVGIGTTSPISKFEVNGTSRFAGSMLQTANGGVNALGDQESMIPNSGFEVNDDATTTIADGWTDITGGTFSVTTSAGQGTNAQTLAATSAESRAVQSLCFPVTGGRTYGVYDMAKGNVTTTDGHYLVMRTFATLQNCIDTASIVDTLIAITDAALTTSWASYGTTVTTGATARWAHVYDQQYLPNTTVTMSIDSIRVIPSALTVGIDIAEAFPVSQTTSIQKGQLVSLSNNYSPEANVALTTPTNTPFDQNVFGIVTTNPAMVLNDEKDYPKVNVALNGRVPAIISTENGSPKLGDYITSSSLPGVGMKSTRAGYTIGKTLQSTDHWNTQHCPTVVSIEKINWPSDDGSNHAQPCFQLPNGTFIGKIMVFVNLSWFDPDILLTSTGDVFLNGQEGNYTISNSNGLVNRIALFSESIIAKLRAGIITTQELFVEKKLVTPLAFIDQLTTRNLSAVDATISGTLTAGIIESPEIENLKSSILNLKSDYASASAIISNIQSHYSTYNALKSLSDTTDPLATSDLITTNATISGQMIINDLIVNDSLITNSLNTSNGDLYIQPSGTNAVNLLAGVMTISPDGKVSVNGDLLLSGTLYADKVNAFEANLTKLNVSTTNPFEKLLAIYNESGQLVSSIDASGSAKFKTLIADNLTIATSSADTNSNASIGTATIPAGQTEMQIENSKIENSTLIYLTPISDTQNQVLYVKNKTENVGFTVSINTPIATDISFNYWLIKTQ